MGKLSREKGRRFEQWVARKLRDMFPDARRGWQSRGGGAEEADVLGVDGYHLELKHLALMQWSKVKAAVAQAERDAKPGRYPVAVLKQNRDKEPMVVMSFTTWMDLLEEQRKEWER